MDRGVLLPWRPLATALVGAGLLVCAASAAAGGPAIHRGVILQIEDGQAIVDLGKKDGLRADLPARVNKRYVLVHPVTKAKIEDELPLGEAKVTSVSESIASVALGAITKAAVGDIVVVTLSEAEERKPEDRPPVTVGCAPCRQDPAAMKVHTAWLLALREDAAGRKNLWLEFLHKNPDSPYKPYVQREMAFLDSLLDVKPRGEEWDTSTYADSSLDRAYEGESLEPAIVLPARARRHLQAVYLYHRRPGAPLFERLEMRPDGDGYYRATLPRQAVARPGVEYFVESVNVAGKAEGIFASARQPWKVQVEPPPLRPDEKAGRSRFNLSYSQVDYYLSKASHDFFWKMDASFTYRVDFHWLRSFKLGFGFFEGFGGDAVVIERIGAGGPGKLDALAFSFVYLEPEIELHEYFAIVPRLTVGQIDRKMLAGLDTGRHTQKVFGGYGFLRIGRRNGTNLYLGAGSTEDAGFESQITMNLAIWERTPLSFSAIVSNVPVNKDLGLILRAEVARQIGDWLEVGLNLGFPARNIRHAGMGAGTSVTFKW
jgi:hypothetical protein